MPESCFVQVDGVTVHFLKVGAGPALLMVHGLVATGKSWDQNFAALSPYRTVYALDMPNMGRSGRAVVDAGLVATAEWLCRFMDVVGVQQADLVGSSHGGAVCLMMAARRPDRVRSLLLFSPANPFCEAPRLLISFYNSLLGTLFARTIPYMPRFAHEMAHRRVYGDPAKMTAGTLEGFTDGFNRQSVDHVLRIVRTWWQDMAELQGVLGQVRGVPAVLIWGGRDGVVTPASGQRLAQAIGAEMVVIEGAGHLPFAEDAEASNDAMLRFLGV